MRNQEQIHEHLNSFLETSSVLAHDISGQSHVAQFCVEELASQVPETAQKFLSRLKDSLDEISQLTGLYRHIVRSQNPKNFPSNWLSMHGVVEGLIQLHYFKDKELFDCRLTQEDGPSRCELAIPSYEAQVLLYAVYVLFVDAFKLNVIDTQPLISVVSDLSADIGVQMRVKGTDKQLVLLEELISQEGPFVGKTLRRSVAMECLKKALKGQQEAVRISFYKQNENIGINLILKKKQGHEQ